MVGDVVTVAATVKDKKVDMAMEGISWRSGNDDFDSLIGCIVVWSLLCKLYLSTSLLDECSDEDEVDIVLKDALWDEDDTL